MTLRERLGLPMPPKPDTPKAQPAPRKPVWLERLPAKDYSRAVAG